MQSDLPERAQKLLDEVYASLLEKGDVKEEDREGFAMGFVFAYAIQQQIINDRDKALDMAMHNIQSITEALKQHNTKKVKSKLELPPMELFVNPNMR